jgi:hypothetical protein
MDTEIIATLIEENDITRKALDNANKELQESRDELLNARKEASKELQYIQKENEEIRETYTLLLKKLRDEEEISIILSKRIEIVEQDFKKYVEKMSLFLRYKDDDANKDDEVLYEKPQLYRTTNQHEWDHIYPLEI